jgi:uncharacterized protein DUF4431
MRRFIAMLLMLAALTGVSRAQDPAQQQLVKEIAAVLEWRLGPETLEQGCRSADPQGAGIRKQALDSWTTRNALLIRSADTRVSEILPLLYPESPPGEANREIRERVGQVLHQSIFAEHSEAEIRGMCHAEADPRRPRWNNDGMPHIQQSLAALHDWQMEHGSGCLSFEPALVELEGVPVLRDYPGPPNYESVARGDALERQWILQLTEPRCVNRDPKSGIDDQAVVGVQEVQLVLAAGESKRLRASAGKQIRVSGTLFAAHTGHHRTAVLLKVENIQ